MCDTYGRFYIFEWNCIPDNARKKTQACDNWKYTKLESNLIRKRLNTSIELYGQIVSLYI